MAISLASLQRASKKPPRIIIHGEAKVGKTTFACSAPNPVVIQTEDGLAGIEVDAFPLATRYEDVLDALGALYTEDHGFQTLVFDSLDWFEPLVWDKACRENKVESIEDIKGGWGKGYVEALYHWKQFFEGLTALRDYKNMTIIMTAHSEVKRMEDPALPAYDYRGLKLHKRAAAIAEEYADCILYASIQTNTVTEDAGFNKKRVRATTTGNRLLHTVGQPAFLAGNRYSLPSPLPLSWEHFSSAMEDHRKAAA